jgi:hypothetical protein
VSTNIWVCGACRSINQARDQRCYKCRTPRELAKVDPENLVVAGAGLSQPVVDAKAVVGVYRSSADRAFLAQVLIVLALAATTISKVVGADVVSRVIDGNVAGADANVALLSILGGAGFLTGVAALTAWAAWLSRVVDNIPALGLGWPTVTAWAALVENFLPGVNLFRVPAIVRDVMAKLGLGSSGDALIAASWLGLVGGVLVPRFGRYATSALAFESGETSAQLGLLIGQIALGFTIVGGIFLIVVIRRIEARAEELARTRPAAPPPQISVSANVLVADDAMVSPPAE